MKRVALLNEIHIASAHTKPVQYLLALDGAATPFLRALNNPLTIATAQLKGGRVQSIIAILLWAQLQSRLNHGNNHSHVLF